MSKRKNHSPALKAKVALEALKGERTVAELSSQFGVPPTLINVWKRALLEGASGVFERGSKRAPEVDETQIKELHAKIGELTVSKRFSKNLNHLNFRKRLNINDVEYVFGSILFQVKRETL